LPLSPTITSPSPATTYRLEAPPFDTTLPPNPPNDLPPWRRFPAVAAAVFIQRRTPLWFEEKYSAVVRRPNHNPITQNIIIMVGLFLVLSGGHGA